jgi:phosphate-selective porin OprO/OprP
MFKATIKRAGYWWVILLGMAFCGFTAADEKTTEVSIKDKLKFESSSDDFKYRFGGRIQADLATYHQQDGSFDDGSEFRRARLFLKGKAYKQWVFKAQFDFSDSDVEIKDLYLGYQFDNAQVLFGQFGEAGSLEHSTSSKYITFMERALPLLAFEPHERRLGVAVNGFGDRYSYSIGIFGDNEAEKEHGKGSSARFSYAPLLDESNVLHLGIFHQYRSPPENKTRFRAKPETHVDNTRLVSTGNIADTSHYTTSGLELAWVTGPFSLQGEYIQARVSRGSALADLSFEGSYIFASWFITGESRPYDAEEGSFGRVKAKNKLSSGGFGALEVALRFSQLNLNDKDIFGGKQDNITLGLNWYAQSNIRLIFNTVKVNADNKTGNTDLQIYQIRAQIDF